MEKWGEERRKIEVSRMRKKSENEMPCNASKCKELVSR